MASGGDPIEAELDKLDAEEKAPGTGSLRRFLPATLAVVTVAGFAAVVWYAYSTGIREGSEFAAPLLEPDGPSKVAPQDPGGREILDQDKLVYGTIDRTQNDTKVERLLPPPENPLPLPVTPKPVEPPPVATPKLGVPSVPPPPSITGPIESPGSTDSEKQAASEAVRKAEEPETKTAEAPKTEPAKTETLQVPRPADAVKPPETPAVPVPKPVPVAKPEPKPNPVPKPAPKKEPVQAAKPTPATPDNYRIQIASLRSEDAAKTAWARRAKEAGPLLGKLTLFVAKADIKGKGTYYRAQGGPFADKAAAQKVCDALKKKKIGCFVVKP